jgi:hypothetical protein
MQARIRSKVPMSKDDSDAQSANIFLFILSAVFFGSISLLITCCTDKINSDHIVTSAKSGSSQFFVSKLLLLILPFVLDTLNDLVQFF